MRYSGVVLIAILMTAAAAWAQQASPEAAAPSSSEAAAESAAIPPRDSAEPAAAQAAAPESTQTATTTGVPAENDAKAAAPAAEASPAAVQPAEAKPAVAVTEPPALAPTVEGHDGPAAALGTDDGASLLLSVGQDGFAVEWDAKDARAVGRFQVSSLGLVAIAFRPLSTEVAFLESDGYGAYRVSAWDYSTRKRLFTLRFREAVSSIAYSGKGSWLIVSRNALDGVVLLDTRSGQRVQKINEQTGPVVFAATGKSERSVLCYSASGELSYWDLEKGTRLQRTKTTPALRSPLLFGGSRFLAGESDGGLAIVDAVSGNLLRRIETGPGLRIVAGPAGNAQLLYLRKTAAGQYFLCSVGSQDPKSMPKEFALTIDSSETISSALGFGEDRVLLGFESGRTALATIKDGKASVVPCAVSSREKIRDAAVSGKDLYVLTSTRVIKAPADPEAFAASSPLKELARMDADRIIAAGNGAVLLYTVGRQGAPLLIDAAGNYGALPFAKPPTIAAAAATATRAAFLEGNGTVSVFDLTERRIIATYKALGLIDLLLLDEKSVLLGKSRSGVPPTTGLTLNFRSGETAPVDLGGQAAGRLIKAADGSIYAVLADSDGKGNASTRLVRMKGDLSGPAVEVARYPGDDSSVSLASSGSGVAATLGDEGALFFNAGKNGEFERGPAFPVRLLAAEGYYLSVDGDGALAWNSAASAALAATLTLRNGEWLLSSGKKTISSGPIE